MKQFIELVIHRDNDVLLGLLEKMKDLADDEFAYNEEKSEMMNTNNVGVGLDGYVYAAFSAKKEDLFFAHVLVSVKDSELKVFNINSEDRRFTELGVLRYNLVVHEFFHHFLAKCLDSSYAGSISMTGEDVSMKEIIGDEVYEALHAWERSCNREMPISNAYDEERWFEFICRLHKSGRYLNPTDFGQWLSEDCGWSTFYNDVISKLEIKLEYSLSLLNYYG